MAGCHNPRNIILPFTSTRKTCKNAPRINDQDKKLRKEWRSHNLASKSTHEEISTIYG